MKHFMIVCAALLCSLALACSESDLVSPEADSGSAVTLEKGKPGRGTETPPGTIYATINGETFTMDGAGQNRADLGVAIWGEPSRLLHGGVRWFVSAQVVGAGCNRYDPATVDCYPDSTSVRAIVVTDSVGHELERVEYPLLDPGAVRWLPGDEGISFYGRRFPDASSPASEGGIYTARVGLNGVPILSDATLIVPTDAWSSESCLANGICQRYPRLGRGGHDWSPSGDRVVYSVCGDYSANDDSTFVFDTRSENAVPFKPWGINPRWSTNDRLLLLDAVYYCSPVGNAKLYSMNSDGSNVSLIERLVHKPKAVSHVSFLSDGTWSPEGEHVIYFLYQCDYNTANSPCSKEIIRRQADGSVKKVLVSEGFGTFGGGILGWR